MKTEEIIKGQLVVDRWYRDRGIGVIKEVLKTRIRIRFPNKEVTYDYPHARQFLDVFKN
jgi:hypothetical protein